MNTCECHGVIDCPASKPPVICSAHGPTKRFTVDFADWRRRVEKAFAEASHEILARLDTPEKK